MCDWRRLRSVGHPGEVAQAPGAVPGTAGSGDGGVRVLAGEAGFDAAGCGSRAVDRVPVREFVLAAFAAMGDEEPVLWTPPIARAVLTVAWRNSRLHSRCGCRYSSSPEKTRTLFPGRRRRSCEEGIGRGTQRGPRWPSIRRTAGRVGPVSVWCASTRRSAAHQRRLPRAAVSRRDSPFRRSAAISLPNWSSLVSADGAFREGSDAVITPAALRSSRSRSALAERVLSSRDVLGRSPSHVKESFLRAAARAVRNLTPPRCRGERRALGCRRRLRGSDQLCRVGSRNFQSVGPFDPAIRRRHAGLGLRTRH